MEEITKKEAIQALSEHYGIPIDTFVNFIKTESKGKKTAKYRVQMYVSPEEVNEEMERVEKTRFYGWNWKPISMTVTDQGTLYILFEKGE